MSRCTILQLVSICLSYYLYYSCSSIPRFYSFTDAFIVTPSRSTTTFSMAIASSRNSRNDASSSSSFRSKRQERIGQEVQKELSDIFHSCPHEIKFTSSLQQLQQVSSSAMGREDELLKRLSIVRVDVSPDLRQAKVIISLVQQQSSSSSNNNNRMMDRRRVYSFVVQYTKQIRHALSQRLKHWKILPQLTFEQANVGAAVDVMMLLNQLNTDTSREGGGLKRAKVGKYGGDDDSLPPMHLLDDEEGEDDDLVWMEDDDGEEDADDIVDASNSLDDEEVEEEEEEEEDGEEEEEKSRKFLKSKDKKKSPPRRRQFRIEDL